MRQKKELARFQDAIQVASALVFGWQEWVALPDLGLPAIRAKIDTGARTSALHALDMQRVDGKSGPELRFAVQPVPRRPDIEIHCRAPLLGEREVTSSNGERERRFVIATTIVIADRSWPIEVTLTDRAQMRARLLIGRQALAHGVLIDPSGSFRQPRLGWRHYPGWNRKRTGKAGG